MSGPVLLERTVEAHSSNGSAAKVGDTQVLPSQILDSYLKNGWQPTKEWNGNLDYSQTGSDTNNTRAKTYETGDTGYVELLPNEPTQDIGTLNGNGEVEDSGDELAETSQLRATVVTSPVLSPTTPALAGHKRDYHGHIVDTVARTPATDLSGAFPLGGGLGGVGLSQLFKQTQADSSPFPFPTEGRSDPIFERPSPDIRLAQPTSPPLALSSPIRLSKKSPLKRALSDSRHVYVSMKDSQERRRQQALLSMSPPSSSEGDDELGDDSEQIRLARRRSRQMFNSKAMKEFASVAIPDNGRRSRKGRRSWSEELQRKDTVAKDQRIIVISDDIHEDELYGTMINDDDEDAASMDEYDELSQAVLRSDRIEDAGEENDPDNVQDENESPEHQDGLVQEETTKPAVSASMGFSGHGFVRSASSPVRRIQRESVTSQLRKSFPTSMRSEPSKDSMGAFDWTKSNASQSLAVADSQPANAMHVYDLVPPPRPVLPSSITSRGFLSQSQAFSLSSATRAELAATPPGLLSENLLTYNKMTKPPGLRRIFSTEDGDLLDSSPPQVASSARQVDARLQAPAYHAQAPSRVPTMDTSTDVQEQIAEPSLPAIPLPVQPLTDPHVLSAESIQALSQTIPETSPMPTPAPGATADPAQLGDPVSANNNVTRPSPSTSGENTTRPAVTQLVESADVFATAQTHPPPSSKASSTKPDSSHDSPPKRPRIRKMTEIAQGLASPSALSPQKAIADFRIMDDDDILFHTTMAGSSPASSPVKRPRRVYRRKGTARTDAAPPEERLSPQSSPTPRGMRHRQGQNEPVVMIPTPTSLATRSGTIRKTRQSGNSELAMEENTSTRADDANVQVAHDGTPTQAPRLIPAESEDELIARPQDHTVSESTEVPRRERHSRKLDTLSDVTNVDEAQVYSTPNRVLAKFRGTYMAYYPATRIESTAVKASCVRVRFDDGTVDEVELKYVIRFELRKGDAVKVDLPGLKAKTWIVRGFKDCITKKDVTQQQFPATDVYGHITVVLELRQRQSLAADGAALESETKEFPIGTIYIPTTMITPFKDRFYQLLSLDQLNPRLHTPVMAISVPTTPSSRNRRQTLNSLANAEARSDLFASKNGIFSNMAFAISYSAESETERNRVRRLLDENGAQILNEGFDELFEVPMPPIISPSKAARASELQHTSTLTLTSGADRLGFTALIADAYSRRAKYMQALALNLPCLSGQWVLHSCQQGKVLPWHRYLLPAGESSFLNGAVRSRTILASTPSLHDPAGTLFKITIDHRAKMLNGKNVLLVMGDGKADEKRKAYLFLTLTLGAERVQRVKGLSAAKSLLDRDGEARVWDWVYVGDAKLAEAKKELQGLVAGSVDLSKKRKRDSPDELGLGLGAGGEDNRNRGRGKKAMLVGDEYVMQSLILGAPLDHEMMMG